jgi:indole-3-glycerol phosphate synthase
VRDVAGSILEQIMTDVRRELAAAQKARPLAELKHRLPDALPVRSLADALRRGFGLIAEVKERSPSQGPMRADNLRDAAAAYETSPIVRAISVLTNASHFGMNIERLHRIKAAGTKPVLRKDFIFDPYQVFEARAFGADAILLMANLLEADELSRLYTLARELGMDALFECHDAAQIASVPEGAVIYGINSRTFSAAATTYETARVRRASGGQSDFTTDLDRFEIGRLLPAHAVKVAESGVSSANLRRVRDLGFYNAVLVGTSLLLQPLGVRHELTAFERALA